MISKRWSRFTQKLVEDGMTDSYELSNTIGVSEPRAADLIYRFTDGREGRPMRRDYQEAVETLVDVSPVLKLHKSARSMFGGRNETLRELNLRMEENAYAIPSSWGGRLIYRDLDANRTPLEDLNMTANLDELSHSDRLDNEPSRSKLDIYLAHFGLQAEDLPIAVPDIEKALQHLAQNEVYKSQTSRHDDHRWTKRERYRLPNASFYLKGTVSNPTMAEYAALTTFTDHAIVDFMVETDILSEDPNDTQPWMLFSRKEDSVELRGARRNIFTYVGAQGTSADFCIQQLPWIVNSFPEMSFSDIRFLGDPEILPISYILNSYL